MNHEIGELQLKDELEAKFDSKLVDDVTTAVTRTETLMNEATLVWKSGLLLLEELDGLGYMVVPKSS